MADKPFTEEQKQYLCGFTFGADVARAVSGLPVLAGSAGGGTAISIGNGSATVDGQALPVGPERIALEAQAATIQAGKKLCKEELAKQAKNPLDMWDEIIARSDAGEFPKGTDVFLQKSHGLFHVAPAQDSYMMRLRIPGGLSRAWQLAGLADLSDRSAGGYLDVTTRANLQFREIPADQAANMLYGIRELDVISLGSGSDNIRNCTASCLSGIDPDELIETIPLAQRMHHYILNHREMYGLPRKFNIAFDGGGRIASLEDTNDIGFKAVQVDASASSDDLPAGVYFQLTLGGITGHQDFARPTGVLLTPDECVPVAGAIVRVFVKNGDRTDRKKARLKYVLDDWGFDRFISEVEKEHGKPLRRVDESRLTFTDNEDRLAHVGVHEQKQKGRYYVGVVLPVGRMTSDQARSLAEIADEYGNGEIRWTVWQNLLIPGIRERDLAEVQAAILACGLDYRASSFRAGLVACTGSAGCKYAGADTKANAMALAVALESQFEIDVPINIHLTGCHHSCAQHYIGDIGLIACQVERGEDMVDGYHVMVGGGWGERRGIGRELLKSIAFDELPPLITNLIDGYLAERHVDESFVDFARRKTIDELRTLTHAPVA
ncbi:NirA family protein [Aporhodopirellula aestuarii]|uniref:NirA family protein n=1 Tax=Aporhodopirellula aestuarii TaxID=2950107 RepID=A0ABT0UD86_9BACT|nr:NirA family protein [Aporhodopirellula aestuarii]MCM2374853.1 NirA family protein [Aporhodopirellula aestuarii]